MYQEIYKKLERGAKKRFPLFLSLILLSHSDMNERCKIRFILIMLENKIPIYFYPTLKNVLNSTGFLFIRSQIFTGCTHWDDSFSIQNLVIVVWTRFNLIEIRLVHFELSLIMYI